MIPKLTSKVVCFFLLAAICAHADFSDHLKKVNGKRTPLFQVKAIDYIYLINLDKRPEKLQRSLAQLRPYNILPHRFSAIYGWDLGRPVLNDLGVKFSMAMQTNELALHFPAGAAAPAHLEMLGLASQGKTYFSKSMTPGAIGCTLSHLSILQDAYAAGYETIWIMEDDILVEKHPHLLSIFIRKLDETLGKNGWDILYTDTDFADREMYVEGNDFESDLKGDLWYFWRPDLDLQKEKPRFARREIVSEDFLRIGSRMRTHSMVIRRSGIKKILDFYKNHHMFIPYDHELAAIPDMRLFSLRQNVVTHIPSPSDTKVRFFSEKIHERGYWMGTEILHEHQFDERLAISLAVFFLKEQAKSVVDLGAGTGAYTKLLRQYQLPTDAFDGNPESQKISSGIVSVADLSQPLNLGKVYDWVLCLEVGEHLPQKYERTLIENLHAHNVKGVVLSWALKGQGGFGHFNEQENGYIKNLMAEYGYINDLQAENELRKAAQLPWFKNTIMVFRKSPSYNFSRQENPQKP